MSQTQTQTHTEIKLLYYRGCNISSALIHYICTKQFDNKSWVLEGARFSLLFKKAPLGMAVCWRFC